MRTTRGCAEVVIAAFAVMTALAGCSAPGGADRGEDQGRSAEPSRRASPSASATATVSLPSDCADLYDPQLSSELAALSLVLNPEWLAAGEWKPRGAVDDQVVAEIEKRDPLTCAWVGPDGPGHALVVTDALRADDETVAVVAARLGQSGHSCSSSTTAATRCTMTFSNENGTGGETHIFRDGFWIATRWSDVYPEDYADRVESAIFD